MELDKNKLIRIFKEIKLTKILLLKNDKIYLSSFRLTKNSKDE